MDDGTHPTLQHGARITRHIFLEWSASLTSVEMDCGRNAPQRASDKPKRYKNRGFYGFVVLDHGSSLHLTKKIWQSGGGTGDRGHGQCSRFLNMVAKSEHIRRSVKKSTLRLVSPDPFGVAR